MNFEFYFPLKKEQLLERPSDNRFWIEEKMNLEELDDDKKQEIIDDLFTNIEKNTIQILENENFIVLFSLLSSYENISNELKNLIIESFQKTLRNFTRALDSFLESQDTYSQAQWRNSLKIYIFFTEWLVESCLNQSKSKKKEIKKVKRKVKGDVNKENEKNTKQISKKKNNLHNSAKKKVTSGHVTEDVPTIDAENILKTMMKLVTINIKSLFRNKIIDEDLMNSMIKINFDILEISNENKNDQNKEKIFEVLQILITKYQSNVNVQIILLKLTTKIVNLIYNQESLVNYLSDFVGLAINGDSNMNKLAVDIIHEMSQTIFKDENLDSQGLKNVGKFLVILSEKSPKTIYNNISSLLKLFDSESYVIRNTLVEMISNVIIKILCNIDEISDVDTRNNYLKTKEKFVEILFDRIYDKSGFCRSKVLHTFEKLCDHNTIAIPNYNKLLKEASGRLKDDKANVRKRAISLISKIIVIYAAILKCDRFLTYEEIANVMRGANLKIEENEALIKMIDLKLIEISKLLDADEDEVTPSKSYKKDKDVHMLNEDDLKEGQKLQIEKNNCKDQIEQEQLLIDYFDNYKSVLKAIDNIIPLTIQLLGSKNISDVQETIDLFVVLHKLRISSSFQGIKKMLNLIMKPEEGIRKKVLEAYQEIYFSKEKPLEIQAAYLIDLTVNLNFSEFTCLRELLKHLIKSSCINMNIFKDIWKILVRNPDSEINKCKIRSQGELHNTVDLLLKESRAASQIINIASDFESSVLLNNSDLYIKNILSNLSKKKIDWLLIKESLVGLQKIYSMKKDVVELSLVKISRTIVKGYGSEDNDWYIACQQFIDTIFQILPNPDKVIQYLIVKLSKPLFVNKNNKNETEQHFMTQNIETQVKSQGMEVDAAVVNDVNTELNAIKLSQLIFVVGHVALNMVVYAEKLESNLKKKRNEKSQDKTQEEIQEIAGGKEAEVEYEINMLHKIVEEEILYKNLLSKFAPMIITIAERSLTCRNSEIKNNLYLYKSAILSLCKFMCISQKFCEDNLPFLFDLLNSDIIDPSLKLNVCAAFGDLINRFPNVLQKQLTNFFSCLHSKNMQVARYSMTVISHLVLNDMLKLKGEIVDICMLLETEDSKLKDLINLFFFELNQKGNNAIYNVIPKALAKLSNDYKHLDYERFQNIVKTLLKYVEKDKHTEGLIEKLFVKMKNSTDVYEWRNTTYCLSLLNYNDKHVMKLLEFYNNLKDRIEDDNVVKENFQLIFGKFKKSTGVNKETIEELEKKFFAGEKMAISKTSRAKGINNKKKVGFKRNYSKMKNGDSDSVDSEYSDSKSIQSEKISTRKVNTRSSATKKKPKPIIEDEGDDISFEDMDSEF